MLQGSWGGKGLLLALLVFWSSLASPGVLEGQEYLLAYEATALPGAPWLVVDSTQGASIAVYDGNGVLTIQKDWFVSPSVMWSAGPLEFTAAGGVTLTMRSRQEKPASSTDPSPLWLSVTDDEGYFAYLFIFSDRIQLHNVNNPNPVAAAQVDATVWREWRVTFASRCVQVFVDGGDTPLIDYVVTTTYSPANTVTFGVPAGYADGMFGGPVTAEIDYLRVAVPDENQPPRVVCAPPIVVNEGDVGRLEGAGSDPDGDVLTCEWTSDGLVIDNPTDWIATFVAPAVPYGGARYAATLTARDAFGAVASCEVAIEVRNVTLFVRGDFGADGRLDLGDAVKELAFLLCRKQGPTCVDAADANDDGRIDVCDPITILAALFGGRRTIPNPYPICGRDPTADALGCQSFVACD